ncbi:MAG TPA: GT4 family glycosyltransferase PelF [Methylomirabilota bacterium]|nr:GT4 family glycosyltransferase PelF [Methylomirabilota bacterium]
MSAPSAAAPGETPPSAPADICLILEGTYPYVTGGVSAWIHQLVGALSELRFAIFHISATRGETHEPRYTMPPNVVSLVDVGIHGGDEPAVKGEAAGPAAWEAMWRYHEELKDGRNDGLADLLRQVSPHAGAGPSVHDYIYGKPAWEIVRRLYESRAPDISFLDYFWTWRFTHLPIFRLLHAPVPEASVYHTVSTGWAGFVAAATRIRRGRPLLLTEHGIYSRERRMEIDQADWIYVQRQAPMTLSAGPGFFKELWARLFERLSRITYAHADQIVTIFEGNRQAQIRDGADPAKTLVVPNGIDPGPLGSLPRIEPAPGEFRIGFVGRVVPIKDVKTFIRAVKIVTNTVPGARAVIAGPGDEDPAYLEECRALAAALGIADRMEFTGRVDVKTIYPRIDVMVLTSISEGLPLVILEAFAAGIPVVSSDVGACRELLEGRGPADRALGASGLVTGLADPAATARAILALAQDGGLREEMARAAQARVRAHYQEADLIRRYREIYRDLRQAR